MKTVFEHIEYVKGKPHHIRRKVAFTAAGACTAAIALVWLVGSLSMGVFALKDNNFADSTGQENVITTPQTDTSNLAGAAAALSNSNAPAHIEIVDTTPVVPAQKRSEQTVIPF